MEGVEELMSAPPTNFPAREVKRSRSYNYFNSASKGLIVQLFWSVGLEGAEGKGGRLQGLRYKVCNILCTVMGTDG